LDAQAAKRQADALLHPYPQITFVRGLLLAMGVIVAVILVHTMQLTNIPTRIIGQTGDAQMDLTINSSMVWRPGDCVDVRWSVDGIQSMFFNTAGVIGADSRVVCPVVDEVLGWHIIFLDGHTEDYALRVYVWLDDNMRRLLGVLVGLVLLRVLAIPAIYRPLAQGGRFIGTKLRGLPWARIGRGYMVLGVLFLSAFIFASVALVGLTFVLQQVDPQHQARLYSQFFRLDAYKLVDRETAQQIGIEFDRMGEQESYMYNPWTVFTERPFTGELVNVLDSGLFPTRRTIEPSSDPAITDELLVWLLGDSTVFGWGMNDANTIASHLQQQLQAELPNQRVRVVNHGHSYFYSAQELALYMALLREAKPDAVIFLNGFNDTWIGSNGVPYFTAQAHAGWESQRQQTYYAGKQPWLAFNTTFPPLHLMTLLQKPAAPPAPQPEMTQAQIDAAIEHILDTYRYNRTMMLAASAAEDVKAFVILRPVMSNWRNQVIQKAFYDALESDVADLPGFYALTSNFNDDYFVDGSHYSDIGSQVVASQITALVLPQLKD
jgi:lysophospholipase L1-like esterase